MIRQPTIAALTEAFLVAAEAGDATADECCIALGGLIIGVSGMAKTPPGELAQKITDTITKTLTKRGGN
jgi:hypothetical protein